MAQSLYDIYTRNTQKKLTLTPAQRALIKRAVKATLKSENWEGRAEVSVTVVDDDRIKELNSAHRGIDSPTDVLSFPLNDGDDIGEELGDIVISIERADYQAKEYGHSLDRELAFLTVHSTLHLLGYDHMTEEEEKDMFGRQEKILNSMGLSR
ncbi:MAG TPA: rRNA maturation RNase YbeY [Clostridiales bacterium]|jgi:probable rRNA maturation factor|nr:rRNA maturation RNase YbeY [Clostridiales bacterium]